ncbi:MULTISPECIES: D-alanyl-D-alanine carboxypeptidase/D-alanyl-D-alanine-endopeptidase [unclassified Massilia]|uniref:D-alanyl-D-alanine carboxypeptidase/D-alanyl-D-alanine endopeptidase n=1 Tax=unclassified Massilia TaxID=2609279 RepID=UPI00177EAB10|nr:MULTISPECIES: D-alanyl-D-alanine carboxypeptidase/D-alanyl-D-alanine-endopeptidase [unclassified Massilia]MBD8532611.1 D-alanyl-D-alanine carboxypeptidase/D-alanyl-D-alanine-endopeptidase [Massilia sp. CFBP 13647]MBD8675972.1 D-alanyl-D-alanine carboxypeptidase/D-alanyl-D-alanine-endopeptidase [Massilia sp. CFBP 13721]
MLRHLTLAAALLACLQHQSQARAQAQLPEPVAQLLALNGMTPDALSVLVLRGDQVVVAHLAERPMQPASTMKLVTTLVSLEQLGPVFRGRTELLTNGELDNQGVLQGDLVLRGGADADLSGEVLVNMLRALQLAGIKRIAGNLVLDRSLFQPARTDVNVPPFDESPEAYYNVIPDALLVNKNMLQLDMRSTDKRLRLDMQPALAGVTVTSNMTLVDADCASWESGWKLPQTVRTADGIKLVLQGTYPKNCARTNSINVLERDDYIDGLFRLTWKQLGGKFTGKTLTGTAPLDARLLAEHRARALPEVVRDTNKPSDNALARTLFLSLGSLEADPLLGSRPLPPLADQTTYARADGAIRSWMRAHAIDDSGFVIENGSGLSRIERISPLQMGALLRAGLRSNWAPEFLASMPIAAMDGTMRRRLNGSPAAGRARLKTGTLRNVVAVAGYVPDANGVQNVVVAMVNDERAGEGRGRAVVDALVDWVARSGVVAPAATQP